MAKALCAAPDAKAASSKVRGVLVVGAGGVGSAIAASLAAAGIASLALYDARPESAQGLSDRLAAHYPRLELSTGSNDPSGYDLVVNATPMGMNDGDPLPVDVARISPDTFVGEVVMKTEMTAFLKAVQARGCRFQTGSDMLFEQIPAYLELFGLASTTASAPVRCPVASFWKIFSRCSSRNGKASSIIRAFCRLVAQLVRAPP